MNAIELMPVHQTAPERHLDKLGLTNYWGYNSIGFFAPDIRFASGNAPASSVTEFKSMVKAFHRAGIEVILDVVYNHTAEGNEYGPTICFRGIDNAIYYRLRPTAAARCEDYTGTGNSLDTDHPRVLQMVMDSLRYWIAEMHVDGFRFDLATTLARGPRGEFAASPFFAAIAQDPVISAVKLDRGAVGRRRGRLSRREFSGQLERMERQVSRRRARFLARREAIRWASLRRASPAARISIAPAAAHRSRASTS